MTTPPTRPQTTTVVQVDTACSATQTLVSYGGLVGRCGGGSSGVSDEQWLGELDGVQTVREDEQDQNCANSRRYYQNMLDSSVTEHLCTGQYSPSGSQ